MRCAEISDHDLELYVMGKPQDDEIRLHLDACPACEPRIHACREYVAAMKKVMQDFERHHSPRRAASNRCRILSFNSRK
jgi:hypothetical protein